MSFPLIANLKVRSSLENAINGGKIPHAIIIAGEAGQGKKTLAEYVAKAFLCKGKEKPCEKCDNCHLANAASHPDIIKLSPEKNKKFITVEQVRNLKEKVYIKPHIADGKVFIITAAERMNANSQNALLKILEEPPENTLFLLLTEKKEALLTTVLSRCVLFSLSSPDFESGVTYVMNKTGCEREKAQTLSKTFHGNIGLMLSGVKAKEKDGAYEIAKKFVPLIFEGGEYEMIKLLSPYYKDRVFTDNFFAELKSAVADEIRAINKNGKRAKVLFSVFEDIDYYIEALKFNANIPLLFCAFAADINKKTR